MLRKTTGLLRKWKQCGRVLWRTPYQKNDKDHQHKTIALLMEKPYPLADICRRMVRIQTKFENTDDTKERSLLRGEYKYFTGKQVDLRGATISDMVATLVCFAFWGFWHVPLGENIIAELSKKVTRFSPEECIALVKSLPTVAGGNCANTPFFQAVARQLVPHLEDLSTEDVIQIIEALEPCAVIPELVDGALLLLQSTWDPSELLTPHEYVMLLATIARLPPVRREPFGTFAQRLQKTLVEQLSELDSQEFGPLIDATNELKLLDAKVDGPYTARHVYRRAMSAKKLTETSCQSVAQACYHLGPSKEKDDLSGSLSNETKDAVAFLYRAVDVVGLRLPAFNYLELFWLCRSFANGLLSQAQDVRTSRKDTKNTMSLVTHTLRDDPCYKTFVSLLERVAFAFGRGDYRVDPTFALGYMDVVVDLKEALPAELLPKCTGEIVRKLSERAIANTTAYSLSETTHFLLLSRRLRPWVLEAAVEQMLKHVVALVKLPNCTKDSCQVLYRTFTRRIVPDTEEEDATYTGSDGSESPFPAIASGTVPTATPVIRSPTSTLTVSSPSDKPLAVKHQRFVHQRILPLLRAKTSGMELEHR